MGNIAKKMAQDSKNLYMEGYKDGRDSVPGIDIKQVEQAISETKGIGESRLRSIMNSIEKKFGGVEDGR